MSDTVDHYVIAPWKRFLNCLGDRNHKIFAQLHERKKPLFLLNIEYIDRLKELVEIFDKLSQQQAEKASLNNAAAVSSFVQLIFNLNGNTAGSDNEHKQLQGLLKGTLWALDVEVNSSESLERFSRLAHWFNEVIRLQQALIEQLETIPESTRLLLLDDENPTFIIGFSSLFNHFYKQLGQLEQSDQLKSLLSMCAILRSTLYQQRHNVVHNALSSLIHIGKAKSPGAAKNIKKAVEYMSQVPTWITQPLSVSRLFDLETIYPNLKKECKPYHELLHVDGFRVLQLLQFVGLDAARTLAVLFINTPLDKFTKLFWDIAEKVLTQAQQTLEHNIERLLTALQTPLHHEDNEQLAAIYTMFYCVHYQLYLLFEKPYVNAQEFEAVYTQLQNCCQAVEQIELSLHSKVHHEIHVLVKRYMNAVFSEKSPSEQAILLTETRKFIQWHSEFSDDQILTPDDLIKINSKMPTLKFTVTKELTKNQVYQDFRLNLQSKSHHSQYFSTYFLKATKNPYNPLWVLDDALSLLTHCQHVDDTVQFLSDDKLIKLLSSVNQYAKIPLPVYGIYTQIQPLKNNIRPYFARVLSDFSNHLLLPQLATIIDQCEHGTYQSTLLRLFKVLSHQMKLQETDSALLHIASDIQYNLVSSLQYTLPGDLRSNLLSFQGLLEQFDKQMKPVWFDFDSDYDFSAYQTPVETIEEQIDTIVYQIKCSEKFNKESSKRHFMPKLAALETLIIQLDDQKQKDRNRSLYRPESNNPILLQAAILQYNYFQLLNDLLTALYQEKTWRSIQIALANILSNTDKYTLSATLSSLLSVERILDIMLTFSEKEKMPGNDAISCIIKALQTQLSTPLSLLLRNHKQRKHLITHSKPYPVDIFLSPNLINLNDLPQFLFESIMQSTTVQDTIGGISDTLAYHSLRSATSTVLASVIPYGGAISLVGSLLLQNTVSNSIRSSIHSQVTRRFGLVHWYFDKQKKGGYDALKAACQIASQIKNSWTDVSVTEKNIDATESLLMLWLQVQVLSHGMNIGDSGVLVLLKILYHDTQADLVLLSDLSKFIAPLLENKTMLARELNDRFQGGNTRKILAHTPYDAMQAALNMVVLKFALESGMKQDAYQMVSQQIPALIAFMEGEVLTKLNMLTRSEHLLKSVEHYSQETVNKINHDTIAFVQAKCLYVQRKINAVGGNKKENFFHGRRNIEVDFLKIIQNPGKSALRSGQELWLMYNVCKVIQFSTHVLYRLFIETRAPSLSRSGHWAAVAFEEVTAPFNLSYTNLLNGFILTGLFILFMAKNALRESSELIPDWNRGEYLSFTRRMASTSLYSVKDVIYSKTINMLIKHIKTIKQLRTNIEHKLAFRSTKTELSAIKHELSHLIDTPNEDVRILAQSLNGVINKLNQSQTHFHDNVTRQYPGWVQHLEQCKNDLTHAQSMMDALPAPVLLLTDERDEQADSKQNHVTPALNDAQLDDKQALQPATLTP